MMKRSLTDEIILQILNLHIRTSLCRAALLLSRRLSHFLPGQVRSEPVHTSPIVTDKVDDVLDRQVPGVP
jgi:hypothetical protein